MMRKPKIPVTRIDHSTIVELGTLRLHKLPLVGDYERFALSFEYEDEEGTMCSISKSFELLVMEDTYKRSRKIEWKAGQFANELVQDLLALKRGDI